MYKYTTNHNSTHTDTQINEISMLVELLSDSKINLEVEQSPHFLIIFLFFLWSPIF
jgi:hypothetical protein